MSDIQLTPVERKLFQDIQSVVADLKLGTVVRVAGDYFTHSSTFCHCYCHLRAFTVSITSFVAIITDGITNDWVINIHTTVCIYLRLSCGYW